MKIAATWRIIIALFVFLLLPTAGFSDNVALNKPVTLNGTFFTGGWGSGLASSEAIVVDGIFLAEGTQWDQGSVWWDTNYYGSQSIEINLGGLYNITGFKVQADDNDTYRISYWDSGTSSWQTAWDVPTQYSYGLVTRPDYSLPAVTTNLLRFEATGGDGFYAVSEIQAYGSQVPVPPTLLLLGSGLLGLAGWRRFRKS